MSTIISSQLVDADAAVVTSMIASLNGLHAQRADYHDHPLGDSEGADALIP